MTTLINRVPLILFTLILFYMTSCSLQAQTEFNGKGISGQWRVVDVKTDEVLRIMEIWEKDGLYHAKIVSLPNLSEQEAAAASCKKCPDKQKGQPLLNMQLVRNLKKEGDRLSEGEIIDILKGKVYKCAMWLENEDRLKVRTLLPLIFKDEVWFRK